MNSKATITHEAEVLESLPNTMFKVRLDGEEKREVLTTLKGILRRRYVRVLPGDRVKVEFSKHDLDRGRIIQKFGRKGRR